MAHGHPPSLGVPSQRDGAKVQGKSPRCLRCPVYEGVGVKELRNVCVSQRFSAVVAIRTKCGWASNKITRLQSALAVLGEDDETERSTLEVALKKAQAQAVVPPVSEQIEDTQKFIERAKKRVVLADEYVQWAQEWEVECDKELLEAEERLARLRMEAERPTLPVPDPATEVQRLQHQLAQAQAQLLQHGSTTVSPGSTAKRPRKREDSVCSCTKEVIEWISDRQMDIQEEIARGNAAEVARLSSLVVQAATSLQPLQPSMVAQFVPSPGSGMIQGLGGQHDQRQSMGTGAVE